VLLGKYDPTLANNGGNGSGNENNSENGNSSGNGNGNANGDPFVDDGVVTTIEEGTVIELPNIYYNFNDAAIRPDAQSDLNSLADFLIKYPATEIELISHTDSRGSDRYNNRLSQRRAENAVAFLIKKGIDRHRMIPRGYGETQLRNECSDFVNCSESDHQYNRRTEVRITKMDAPITIKFINNLPSYISEAPPAIKSSGKNKTNISPSNPASTEIDLSQEQDDYDPEGNYKVIAGAFSNMNNAEKRLIEVRALGFNNADILKLGGSSLFHVVVSRYNTSESASNAVRILKSNNLRAFIKS
jgi:outer membrane protein OmpA-like peptidoglycan-associated protein